MSGKNSQEYVIAEGVKYFVEDGQLTLDDITCKLSEIEGLEK